MINYKFTKRQITLTLLTICYTTFIFSNSLQTAAISSNHSGNVVKIIESFLSFLGYPVSISEFIIRKLAHFIEYTGLGILLCVTLRTYTKRILNHIFVPLFIGLAVPVTDEFIQLFVDGRGSMVQDVVLDFVGVLTGLIFTAICILLVEKRKLSRNRKGRANENITD